jgi:hypothetical protein
MGTCSLRIDPPDKDGIDIPIKERALDDPSDDGMKDISERYSGLVRTNAFTMAMARTTIKLIAISMRRFHRNNKKLSKKIPFVAQ